MEIFEELDSSIPQLFALFESCKDEASRQRAAVLIQEARRALEAGKACLNLSPSEIPDGGEEVIPSEVQNHTKPIELVVTRDPLESHPDKKQWRKYGVKKIKRAIYPRHYLRCANSCKSSKGCKSVQGCKGLQGCKACPALKRVEKNDRGEFFVVYLNSHNRSCGYPYIPPPSHEQNVGDVNDNQQEQHNFPESLSQVNGSSSEHVETLQQPRLPSHCIPRMLSNEQNAGVANQNAMHHEQQHLTLCSSLANGFSFDNDWDHLQQEFFPLDSFQRPFQDEIIHEQNIGIVHENRHEQQNLPLHTSAENHRISFEHAGTAQQLHLPSVYMRGTGPDGISHGKNAAVVDENHYEDRLLSLRSSQLNGIDYVQNAAGPSSVDGLRHFPLSSVLEMLQQMTGVVQSALANIQQQSPLARFGQAMVQAQSDASVSLEQNLGISNRSLQPYEI